MAGNIPVGGFGAGGGGSTLAIASVVAMSSTTVQVTFDQPALVNAALLTPALYVIDPPLPVYSVTPGSSPSTLTVLLSTGEQKNGESYDLELQAAEPF